jgi:hypothetical protein
VGAGSGDTAGNAFGGNPPLTIEHAHVIATAMKQKKNVSEVQTARRARDMHCPPNGF